MMVELSKFKSENSEGLGLGSPHVKNQVILNDSKFLCSGIHMWIHSMKCRFPQIYVLYFEFIKITSSNEKNKTDADTMCGN